LPGKRDFVVTPLDDSVQTAAAVQGDERCGGGGIVTGCREVSGEGSEPASSGDRFMLHL